LISFIARLKIGFNGWGVRNPLNQLPKMLCFLASHRGQRVPRTCIFSALAITLCWFSKDALAVPVKLEAVESTAPVDPAHPLEAAVDGSLTNGNGWNFHSAESNPPFAVFATTSPLVAETLLLQFHFLPPESVSQLSSLRVSVTTDERPGLTAHWRPLIPDAAIANCRDPLKLQGVTVYLPTNCPLSLLTVRVRAPFGGITGFRLKLTPAPGFETAPPGTNSSPEAGFLLTEFSVEADPLRTSNIALGRQVFVGGRAGSALPARNLTDGFYGTYSRPDVHWKEKPFFFELDLGKNTPLDHILIRGRDDASEQNRLCCYRIEIRDEPAGLPPKVQWTGTFHSDGSHPPLDGADIIREQDGSGVFAGRDIRIYRTRDDLIQPQIAELEVYPRVTPQASYWLADGKFLSDGLNVHVPAGIRKLEFTIVSDAPPLARDMVAYRWRIPGWSESWHETAPDGRVTLSPPPPPGSFQLAMQARHTDGIWSEPGGSVALQFAFPWWRNPKLLAIVVGNLVLAASLSWWFAHTVLMRRRLALAEKNLELHTERLRIARDMHDEIGARLTHVALLADRTHQEANGALPGQGAQLERLAEYARSAVGALDAIVWAVNPEHDSLESFADYSYDYALEYLKTAGIQCLFDMQIQTPKASLGLRTRHQLLMAVKEALQNVVKHAAATSVRFSFREERQGVDLKITDNGRGFSPDMAPEHRNGLALMRQRLSEIGGRCEISPGEGGRGTCVHFTVPLEHQPAGAPHGSSNHGSQSQPG
jgi:signal transduction histidine kinase